MDVTGQSGSGASANGNGNGHVNGHGDGYPAGGWSEGWSGAGSALEPETDSVVPAWRRGMDALNHARAQTPPRYAELLAEAGVRPPEPVELPEDEDPLDGSTPFRNAEFAGFPADEGMIQPLSFTQPHHPDPPLYAEPSPVEPASHAPAGPALNGSTPSQGTPSPFARLLEVPSVPSAPPAPRASTYPPAAAHPQPPIQPPTPPPAPEPVAPAISVPEPIAYPARLNPAQPVSSGAPAQPSPTGILLPAYHRAEPIVPVDPEPPRGLADRLDPADPRPPAPPGLRVPAPAAYLPPTEPADHIGPSRDVPPRDLPHRAAPRDIPPREPLAYQPHDPHSSRDPREPFGQQPNPSRDQRESLGQQPQPHEQFPPRDPRAYQPHDPRSPRDPRDQPESFGRQPDEQLSPRDPRDPREVLGPPPNEQPDLRSSTEPPPSPVARDRSEPTHSLPQRVPSEPDVPRIPEPNTEPPAPAPALSRIASGLRRDDLPPSDRPDGFDVATVLSAVRDVPGVRDAQLRATATGGHTLRLDLADGSDPAYVSRVVARMLNERMGLVAEPPARPTPTPSEAPSSSPAPYSPSPSPSSAVPSPAVPSVGPSPVGPPSPEPPAAHEEAPRLQVPAQPVGPAEPRPDRTPIPPAQRGASPPLPPGLIPASAAPREPRRRHPVTMRGRYPDPLRPGGDRFGRPDEQPEPGRPPALTPPAEAARVVLDHVQVSTFGLDATVEVRLVAGERVALGVSNGPAVDGYVLRLCAAAAANAVDELLSESADGQTRGHCYVEQAAILPMGSCEVAVVVVLLVCDGWVEQLAGSALVSGDPRQAVVRATLAAVNRRLSALLP
ncbi:MAG: hypothetical protein HOU81_07055 [Hamadaea sp.]|uniref:hypothetical protein n=1 Tax=Hamadaea sp. TaxID=2024425 RepID=UPI0017990954|nr:hypothetical protein [Hamadaea sp.]NUR70561.1 hypothetical protein [Hamadaea sp.]NUT19310.1 hypothetical protein [Hamadaea sp.]